MNYNKYVDREKFDGFTSSDEIIEAITKLVDRNLSDEDADMDYCGNVGESPAMEEFTRIWSGATKAQEEAVDQYLIEHLEEGDVVYWGIGKGTKKNGKMEWS